MRELVLLFFVLTLVPIVSVGLYARPLLDDYSFSALSSFMPCADTPVEYYTARSVRHAVTHGNFIDILRAVGRTVSDNYFAWQGTFSAIALFSVQPAVLFGAGAYPLTMLISLFALIAATAFLCKTVFKENALIIGVIILTCCIQWLPHIGQGFFWYNSAVYYTFFYSLFLFNLAMKIRLLQAEKPCIYKIIGVAALSFFIGGGNYVTALLNAEVAVLFAAFAIFKYRNDWKKWLPFALFALFAGAGLIISAAAPGNAVRGAIAVNNFEFSAANIAYTLVFSIGQGLFDIIHWLSPGVVVLLLLAVPAMWKYVRAVQCDFRYPIAVSVLSFLLFASQNAPPIYAMGFAGDPKLRNIVFFSYILLLFGNAVYWLGWLSRRTQMRITVTKNQKIFVYTVLFAVLLTLGAGWRLDPQERGVSLHHERAASTLLTARDLRAGLPQRFLYEHQARQNLLQNSAGEIIYVPAFTAMPLTLVPFQPFDWASGTANAELTRNPNHWANRSVAAYYGAAGVIALPPERSTAELVPVEFHFRGRVFEVDSYRMADVFYFNLRDVGYILQFVYDVELYNGQINIATRRLYALVGGEAAPQSAVRGRLYPAELYNNTLLIDHMTHAIPSYVIGGRIFHRDDFFTALGIVLYISDGVAHVDLTRPNVNMRSFGVFFDDAEIMFGDAQPILAGEYIPLVPVRPLFEALGYLVEWNSETQTVTLSNDSFTVQLTLGAEYFTRNGASLRLEFPALILGTSTYAPVNILLASLGYEVSRAGYILRITTR